MLFAMPTPTSWPRICAARRHTALRFPGMVAKAHAAAAAQTVRLPGEAATAALITRQARKLLDLDREIKDFDKQITERFRAHPQARIIESMPGMGPILGESSPRSPPVTSRP